MAFGQDGHGAEELDKAFELSKLSLKWSLDTGVETDIKTGTRKIKA